MGAYLTIVNTTPDPWQCKIGPDEAALKIAGIIISIVGALASVIGGAAVIGGLAAWLTANGVVGVFGVSTSALAAVGGGAGAAAGYASVVGSVSGFGIGMAKVLGDKLSDDGYQRIAPGGKHRWGKMSLSLWQQGTCVKTVLVDEKTVRMETLYMRPIFSGATDNSNNDHQIQWWIDKWGTEKQEIVAHTETGRNLEEANEVANRTLSEFTQ
jgi:hypothetical protein